MSQRELYGASYRVKEKITPSDLFARTQHVIGKEVDVVRNQREQGPSAQRVPPLNPDGGDPRRRLAL